MKWVDGKPIYRKLIYVNGLPNGFNDSGIKSVATGISNMDYMVNMYGAYTGSGNHSDEKYPINYIRRDNSLCDISTEYKYYDGAMSLVIRSQLGEYYKGYVILEYTKTTDYGYEKCAMNTRFTTPLSTYAYIMCFSIILK